MSRRQDFLFTNNMLNSNQFGFITGKSKDSAIHIRTPSIFVQQVFFQINKKCVAIGGWLQTSTRSPERGAGSHVQHSTTSSTNITGTFFLRALLTTNCCIDRCDSGSILAAKRVDIDRDHAVLHGKPERPRITDKIYYIFLHHLILVCMWYLLLVVHINSRSRRIDRGRAPLALYSSVSHSFEYINHFLIIALYFTANKHEQLSVFTCVGRYHCLNERYVHGEENGSS